MNSTMPVRAVADSNRRRFAVLVTAVLMMVQTIAAVSITRFAAERLQLTNVMYAVGTSALMFLALTSFLGPRVPEGISSILVEPRDLAVRLALSIAGWLGIEAALSFSMPTAVLANVPRFFVPALVEEIVFRRVLPSQFSHILSLMPLSRRILSTVSTLAAALTFSLCHVTWQSAHLSTSSTQSFLRMIVVGLLYSALLQATGLWFAASVHSALNVHVTRMVSWTSGRPSAIWLAFGAAVALSIVHFGRAARLRMPRAEDYHATRRRS